MWGRVDYLHGLGWRLHGGWGRGVRISVVDVLGQGDVAGYVGGLEILILMYI